MQISGDQPQSWRTTGYTGFSASPALTHLIQLIKGTVLTYDKDIDTDRVVVQTSQSITIIGCMDRLKYLEECTHNKTNSNREVECLSNCTVKPFDQEPIKPEHNICFGGWCVPGITFVLTFGISAAVIIIILVLLIRYKIHLYRVCMFVGHRVNGSTREPSPDPEKPQSHPVNYSAVNQ
ncbi:uncharacterized protein LOC115174454 isoform X2 [Salmo trutta]|uniref:uncharacterized protein LOC115174454 isoform X2 n=1 Tax=Salmo trutta TaxID=8032 RepID=UPI001130732F|nr:uncharacterized protein LOC115174454 isoform X2 [Salmo trutta]